MDRGGKGLSAMPATQYPLRYPRLVVVATAAVTATASNHWRGNPWSKYLTSLPMNLTLVSQKKPQLLILATEHGARSSFGSRDEFFVAKERSSSSEGRKSYPTGKWEEEQTQPRSLSHHQPWEPTARVTVISQTFTDRSSSRTLKATGLEKRQKTCVLGADRWRVYFPERMF